MFAIARVASESPDLSPEDDLEVEHHETAARVGYTSELGLRVTGDGDALRGRALAVPEVCVPEAAVIRPSVLLTWGDILNGSWRTSTRPRGSA